MKNTARLFMLLACLQWIQPALAQSSQDFDLNQRISDVRSRAQKELALKLVTSKTVGGFIDKLSAEIDPEATRFFREKVKGLEKQPIKTESRGSGEFILKTGRSLTRFTIREGERGLISMALNNHSFTYDPGESLQVLWDKVGKAIPKSSAHSSLLLPEAQAELLTALAVALVIQTGLIAGGVLLYKLTTCGTYKEYVAKCEFGFATMTQILAAADYDQGRPVLLCGKVRERLYRCLKSEVAKKNHPVPVGYGAYFGRAEYPSTGASAPAKRAE